MFVGKLDIKKLDEAIADIQQRKPDEVISLTMNRNSFRELLSTNRVIETEWSNCYGDCVVRLNEAVRDCEVFIL